MYKKNILIRWKSISFSFSLFLISIFDYCFLIDLDTTSRYKVGHKAYSFMLRQRSYMERKNSGEELNLSVWINQLLKEIPSSNSVRLVFRDGTVLDKTEDPKRKWLEAIRDLLGEVESPKVHFADPHTQGRLKELIMGPFGFEVSEALWRLIINIINESKDKGKNEIVIARIGYDIKSQEISFSLSYPKRLKHLSFHISKNADSELPGPIEDKLSLLKPEPKKDLKGGGYEIPAQQI